jgi:DNA-binding NtrC family response regulator
LAEFLIRKHSTEVPLPQITPDLRQAFLSYHWPGNIRELENVVRKLLILRNPAETVAELNRKTRTPHLVGEIAVLQTPAPQTNAPYGHSPILEQVTQAKQQAESEAILAALDSTRWNRKQAAAVLKIDYKALLYKMKKLGM